MENISVVLCTYNRKKFLQNALDSLLYQNFDDEFSYEIVVIDDGSTDGTEHTVREHIQKVTTVPIRYARTKGVGIAEARNKGVNENHGKWIAFFDDDEVADPKWIFELYKVARETGADCIGGTIVLKLPESFDLDLGPFCRGLLEETYLEQESLRYPKNDIPSTSNVLIRRALFDKIGGFDANMHYGGSDADFFWRAHTYGAEIWYAPNAITYHIISESRLKEEYFKCDALRLGASSARARYKYNGCFRWFIALGQRIFRGLALDAWSLLIAIILRNRSKQLERKCRLWAMLGYFRESLTLLMPNVFIQLSFFDGIRFRKDS